MPSLLSSNSTGHEGRFWLSTKNNPVPSVEDGIQHMPPGIRIVFHNELIFSMTHQPLDEYDRKYSICLKMLGKLFYCHLKLPVSLKGCLKETRSVSFSLLNNRNHEDMKISIIDFINGVVANSIIKYCKLVSEYYTNRKIS